MEYVWSIYGVCMEYLRMMSDGKGKEKGNEENVFSTKKELEKQELWGRNREKLRKIKHELFFRNPLGESEILVNFAFVYTKRNDIKPK